MKKVTVYKSSKSKYIFAMTNCFSKSEIVELTFEEFMKFKGTVILEKNYRLSNKTAIVSESLFNKYAI